MMWCTSFKWSCNLLLNEIDEKISQLSGHVYVLKAQIHAGGRGKVGGVKLIKNISELKSEAKKLMGKKVTHQTGLKDVR